MKNFDAGIDVYDAWKENLFSGEPPTVYQTGFSDLSLGPGQVILIGGAPGVGKTALVCQLLFDTLYAHPSLRAAVMNVEMSPFELLNRQLARYSRIPLNTIRRRKITEEHAENIAEGIEILAAITARICFVSAPFSLENLGETADEFNTNIIVLDYIQRITPPGNHKDKRSSVNETMDRLRRAANTGCCIIVVSAVGRTRDSKGRSSYDPSGLALASFRESSELEYGADAAFILGPGGLKCCKNRNDEPKDIPLIFEREFQSFSLAKNVLEATWKNTRI